MLNPFFKVQIGSNLTSCLGATLWKVLSLEDKLEFWCNEAKFGCYLSFRAYCCKFEHYTNELSPCHNTQMACSIFDSVIVYHVLVKTGSEFGREPSNLTCIVQRTVYEHNINNRVDHELFWPFLFITFLEVPKSCF